MRRVPCASLTSPGCRAVVLILKLKVGDADAVLLQERLAEMWKPLLDVTFFSEHEKKNITACLLTIEPRTDEPSNRFALQR